MRHHLERLAPTLLAALAAGGVVAVWALPADAEPTPPRRDRLHAERPIAAPDDSPGAFGATPLDVAHALALDEVAIPAPEPDLRPDPSPDPERPGRPAGPAATAAAPDATPVATSTVPAGTCAGDVDCFLACTRAHESDTSGGYGAVSAGGHYRGAYQFQQRTWDAAVTGAGFGEYAGLPADAAPPEVQDAAAAHLYAVSGNRPWGGRC